MTWCIRRSLFELHVELARPRQLELVLELARASGRGTSARRLRPDRPTAMRARRDHRAGASPRSARCHQELTYTGRPARQSREFASLVSSFFASGHASTTTNEVTSEIRVARRLASAAAGTGCSGGCSTGAGEPVPTPGNDSDHQNPAHLRHDVTRAAAGATFVVRATATRGARLGQWLWGERSRASRTCATLTESELRDAARTAVGPSSACGQSGRSRCARPMRSPSSARAHEPDAGVRRNLAVVLAGHGQLDLLVALAKRDPAPEVRAAAMQLVARFAIDDKLPHALVVERAHDRQQRGEASRCSARCSRARRRGSLEIAREADRGSRRRRPLRSVRSARARWLATSIATDVARGGTGGRGAARADAVERARSRACVRRGARAAHRGGCGDCSIESVRIATWQDLAPAIGDDIALDPGARAAQSDRCSTRCRSRALMRTTLREPNAAWIAMVRDRLAQLEIARRRSRRRAAATTFASCARGVIARVDAAIKRAHASSATTTSSTRSRCSRISASCSRARSSTRRACSFTELGNRP